MDIDMEVQLKKASTGTPAIYVILIKFCTACLFILLQIQLKIIQASPMDNNGNQL